MMPNVQIPHIKVAVLVEGLSVAIFTFTRVELHPQDWHITAALLDTDTGAAVRTCLLACIAEIGYGQWEFVEGTHSQLGADGAEQIPF